MLPEKDILLAVRRTLAYAEVFGENLSQPEIWRFLHLGQRVSIDQLHAVVEFRTAPIKRAVSDVEPAKWRAVHQAASFFAHIPWIRGVWVTGALAAGTAKDDDDLDFLFLTDPDRMWLSRAWVVGIGLLLGKYRSRWRPRRSHKNMWCCNIWLEPGALALPPERRTLYEARELIQAIPVYVRPGERASLLLEKNRWAEKFVANGFALSRERGQRVVSPTGALPVWILSPIDHLLNLLLQTIQRAIMARRMTREVVESGSAFFHPRDTRSWVWKRYETICSASNIQPCFNEPTP